MADAFLAAGFTTTRSAPMAVGEHAPASRASSLAGRRREEPVYDVAHLGRVELLTPDLPASVGFFVDVLGMEEVERAGDSVFLRAWGDYERASLQLTAADRPGVGTIAWRATSDAALERRVAAVEASGRGEGWSTGAPATAAPIGSAIPTGTACRSTTRASTTSPPATRSRR